MNAEGIFSQDSTGSRHVIWTAYSKVVETKALFLLQLPSGLVQMFSKADLSVAQLEDLRLLLQANISDVQFLK
ncbi:YcxB family protein [Lapidilactobacillus bayanensis]|uniref:YcxB family protein n=1 Tax=Lapidilactobacillus bayanensis TaxID=2485998 RepID=UPI000F78E0C2|nr:YcxB family protein [Lapidilactobacillus bayanensis]